MHRFKLGSPAFHLYLYLTQKKLSAAEFAPLKKGMILCARGFERFLRTPQGGTLPPKTIVEMTLTICGIAKMRSLNRQYCDQNRPTDVLSFPLHHNLKEEGYAGLPRPCLGDIYICREVALEQSVKFQLSYYEELCHLFVHGFLHLLGYDHEISQRAEKEMLQCEDDLLKDMMENREWKSLSK